MEPHGLSRWRHGCSRIAPVSPRRRPGGDTVAPGVFPVYHGIWQPSRFLPVSPGCFKHFKTTGDMSRFNTVQHGSSRISKVVHGAATVVTRFIPDHQTGMNRHLKPGQWERGLKRVFRTIGIRLFDFFTVVDDGLDKHQDISCWAAFCAYVIRIFFTLPGPNCIMSCCK